MLSETVWAILQVRTKRTMGNLIKIQCWASWAKMMNPAGWWAQPRKRCSNSWRDFDRSRWSLTNWHDQDWGTRLDYLHEWDTKYYTTKLKVPAVVTLDTDYDAANPAPTKFGEHMESLDIIPGVSWMQKGTSRPGRSHIRLGSGRPQSPECIASLAHNVKSDSSVIKNQKPVQTVCHCPCICPCPKSQYRNRMRMKIWWRHVPRWKNRYAYFFFWRHIKWKSHVCTYFATCQLLLDLSEQTVSHEDSSVHVQGWYVPWESSSVGIWLQDKQLTR